VFEHESPGNLPALIASIHVRCDLVETPNAWMAGVRPRLSGSFF